MSDFALLAGAVTAWPPFRILISICALCLILPWVIHDLRIRSWRWSIKDVAIWTALLAGSLALSRQDFEQVADFVEVRNLGFFEISTVLGPALICLVLSEAAARRQIKHPDEDRAGKSPMLLLLLMPLLSITVLLATILVAALAVRIL